MTRKIVLAAVALAVIGGLAAFFLRSDKNDRTYRTAKLERGAVRASVSATGPVNAVTTVLVGTQISGTIQHLYVDFNSRVKKGQVIAQIEPALVEAQVQQTRGNYLNAKANAEKAAATLEDARRSLERQRQLVKEGIVAASEYDAAETRYRESQAAVRALEGQVAQSLGSLRQAQTNLGYTVIRSPVDGIVVSRNVDVGQTVAASFQTPTLFTIAQDLTRMQIEASVDEADIGRVAVGQEVGFTVDAYPDQRFRGRVTQVRNAPVITQNVVTYGVIIAVDNTDLRLKPGMTANVVIETARKEDVLKAPMAALRFRPKGAEEAGGRKGKGEKVEKVYLLSAENRPVPVQVKTGLSGENEIEIISDTLKAGDAVIVAETGAKKPAAGGAPMKMGPRF
ncbi:MAG TPA: efflux RND transporter periplasmic adaptor subunit [Verrucomicrobiae bacterium]|nr:efflux RND transporter periplasmic adaptor subunit [Verrucomicrobiae bacterium]